MNHTSHTMLAEEEDAGTSCAICFLAFSPSEADHVPRLLKCGHSFCTACLTHLLYATSSTNLEAEPEEEATSLRCPKCRGVTLLVHEEATGAKGLPRNFDLIELLYSSAALRQPRPTGEAALKCANCGQPAKTFCEQCDRAHLCVSCDRQIHTFPVLRSHTRVASADAPEPRASCEHHRGKKVEMWCERDGVAVCVVCLVAGPHKGHGAITIEAAKERVCQAASVELARVEAALGELEVAIGRQTAREAAEHESAREARAAIEQHFDQVREAADQRQMALAAEVDEWVRNMADAAAERRFELAEAQGRLASAGEALQQSGRLGRSSTWGGIGAACRAARTVAAAATASSGIAFASEDARVQVGALGRLEPVAAAAAVVNNTAGMPAVVQRTLGSGEQFGSPRGVAVDSEAGSIIVADCGSREVHLCRAHDGGPGSAQLRWPWGVAVDTAAGFIFVTDHLNHRVHVWLADDGSYCSTFGSRGCGPGQFQCPRGVAVDTEAGLIFVADHFNHRVQVWSTDDPSSFLDSFGSEGTGPGQFLQPTGVAVDQARGHVIVADSGNHRVQVWRADDTSFVRSFGSRGGGRGQFMCPEGVAVDPATGNIVVADWGNHRVQVWSADGTFLRAFGSDGAGPAQFHSPSGVAVDPETGHILVADSGNKRVQPKLPSFQDEALSLPPLHQHRVPPTPKEEAKSLRGPVGLPINFDFIVSHVPSMCANCSQPAKAFFKLPPRLSSCEQRRCRSV